MFLRHYSFNAKKQVINGLVRARTIDDARSKLIAKKLNPVIIQRFDLLPSVFKKVKQVDILFFLKNLSLLLKSGISLGEALEESAGLIRAKHLRKVIIEVGQEVTAGNTMTNALKKHQDIFSLTTINLLRIGEETGNISELVSRVAEQEDKGFELKKKLRSAAAYPLIIISITVVLLAAFVVFVLPRFNLLFLSIGAEVPPVITIFIQIGTFVNNQGWLAAIYIFIIIYLWRLLVRLPVISNIWNRLLLSTPIVAPVIKDYNLAGINRMLGILLNSGIDAVKSLEIAAESVSNSVYAKSLLEISVDVAAGQGFKEAFVARKHLYPSLEVRVVNAGEKSGSLGNAFDYLSDFYFRELDYSTKTLSTIMEPALLLFVGIIIGGLALSIITPIYDFVSTVGN